MYSITPPWDSYKIHKIAGCACARNAGKFPLQGKPQVKLSITKRAWLCFGEVIPTLPSKTCALFTYPLQWLISPWCNQIRAPVPVWVTRIDMGEFDNLLLQLTTLKTDPSCIFSGYILHKLNTWLTHNERRQNHPRYSSNTWTMYCIIRYLNNFMVWYYANITHQFWCVFNGQGSQLQIPFAYMVLFYKNRTWPKYWDTYMGSRRNPPRVVIMEILE